MLTVHVGLHKTGSSSIQVALKRSLSRRQIRVPEDGERLDAETVTGILRKLPANGVFSNENILGSPFDGYSEAPDRVDAICSGLDGRPTRIFLYVRAQLDWLNSLYLQSIQQGGTQSPGQFVETVSASPWVNWLDLYHLLVRASGAREVIFRPYRGNADMVNEFFTAAGLPLARSASLRMGRVNKSISPEHAVLLRSVSERELLTAKETGILRSLLQGMPPRRGDRASLFTGALQSEIRKKFAESWFELASATSLGLEVRHAFESVYEDASWDEAPFVGAFGSSPRINEAALDVIGKLVERLSVRAPLAPRGVLGIMDTVRDRLPWRTRHD